jgi:hypothetical protein
MTTDLEILEQQEEAELKARQEARRTAREAEDFIKAMEAAKLEAARKAQALLAYTKTEALPRIVDTFDRDLSAKIVYEGAGGEKRTAVFSKEPKRTSAQDQAIVRQLSPPEIFIGAKGAFMEYYARAHNVQGKHSVFAELNFDGLVRALKSAHGTQNGMTVASHKRLKALIKILQRRQRRETTGE